MNIDPRIVIKNLHAMARAANYPADAHEALAAQVTGLTEWTESAITELQKFKDMAAAEMARKEEVPENHEDA